MKILSYCLVILILTVSSKDLLTWGSFQWHKKYIKEKYCVNITNPTLDCGGVCYINTQIQKVKEKQSESEPNFSLNEISQLFYIIPVFDLIKPAKLVSKNWNNRFFYILIQGTLLIKGIFHPPLLKK